MSASINLEDEHRNPVVSTMTYNMHGKRQTIYNIDANADLQNKIIQQVTPCKHVSSSEQPFKKKRKMFLLVIEEDSDSDIGESKKQNSENSTVLKLVGKTDIDNVEINEVQINNGTPANNVLNLTSINMVIDETCEQDKKIITTGSAPQASVTTEKSDTIENKIGDISVTSKQNNTSLIIKKENCDVSSSDVPDNINSDKLFISVQNRETSLIVPKSEPVEGKMRRGRKRIYPVPDSLACSHCGKQLATIAGHRSHEMACMGIKPHVCDICGRGFAQKVTLQCHYATHTEGKPITCEVCSKTFKSEERLNRHKLGVHDQSKRIYRCTHCNKCFQKKRVFDNHLNIHTGNKPYVCEVCGKGFKHPSTLHSHQQVHQMQLYHACDLCSEKRYFKHIASFRKHVKKFHPEDYEKMINEGCFQLKLFAKKEIQENI